MIRVLSIKVLYLLLVPDVKAELYVMMGYR